MNTERIEKKPCQNSTTINNKTPQKWQRNRFVESECILHTARNYSSSLSSFSLPWKNFERLSIVSNSSRTSSPCWTDALSCLRALFRGLDSSEILLIFRDSSTRLFASWPKHDLIPLFSVTTSTWIAFLNCNKTHENSSNHTDLLNIHQSHLFIKYPLIT